MKTPVAFFIFKRPETTAKVFEAIRQAKPAKLFVIADGPRTSVSGESEKCLATRAIIDRVDWDCEVFTNYSDVNFGLKSRVSSGLDWVFNQVESAIILEDDCLPDLSFFHFCDELLDKYQDDERIVVVSGNNFQFGQVRTHDSYYFSRYNHCWGWATWRRAWQYYDNEMKLWPLVRDQQWLKDILPDSFALKYWTNIFESTYEGKIDSWAYTWTFSCWLQNGLTILPNVNLVSNIGHSLEASNTKNSKDIYASMPSFAIDFPLQHPNFVIRNDRADHFTQKTHFKSPSLLRQLKNTVKLGLSNL